MDVALRAVSWIWGFHYMADAPACRDAAFRSSFLRALFLHGEFVTTHLERGDVNGNHYPLRRRGPRLSRLLLQARPARQALARRRPRHRRPGNPEPDHRRRRGLRAVDRVSPARPRSRSSRRTSCWCDTTNRCRPRPLARLERMCEFVLAYTKPDGRVPLIGDADDGRIQMLGSQAINDHRYLLSSAALIFGTRRSCQCRRTLLGGDLLAARLECRRAVRRRRRRAPVRPRPRRRSPTAASTCCDRPLRTWSSTAARSG